MMDKCYYVSYKDSINDCMLGDHYLLLTSDKDCTSAYNLDD